MADVQDIIHVFYDSSGLYQVDPRSLSSSWKSEDSGTPTYWYQTEGDPTDLSLWPPPDADNEDIHAILKVGTRLDASGVPEVFALPHYLYALHLAFMYEGEGKDPDRSQFFLTLFQAVMSHLMSTILAYRRL